MIYRTPHGIDHAHSHQHEEISHLSDGHSFRAITDNAENGKQAECSSCVHQIIFHQGHKHEDADGHDDKYEHIIAAITLGEIEATCDNGHHYKVYDEADDE